MQIVRKIVFLFYSSYFSVIMDLLNHICHSNFSKEFLAGNLKEDCKAIQSYHDTVLQEAEQLFLFPNYHNHYFYYKQLQKLNSNLKHYHLEYSLSIPHSYNLLKAQNYLIELLHYAIPLLKKSNQYLKHQLSRVQNYLDVEPVGILTNFNLPYYQLFLEENSKNKISVYQIYQKEWQISYSPIYYQNSIIKFVGEFEITLQHTIDQIKLNLFSQTPKSNQFVFNSWKINSLIPMPKQRCMVPLGMLKINAHHNSIEKL